MDEADKQQLSTLLQSGRSNSEIAYWLSRAYPHEIETLNLETGDIADYRTTAQGMELEVLDAEEKRLAVLYFRWDEVAPLLRGMYARQQDGFGQEQPQPAAESPTFHSETMAVYPGDKNHLPYDVEVERLHIEEPEPPAPVTEPEKTFEEVLDEHPVSIQVNGQWQTFPNAKAAEEASYEEYKATVIELISRFYDVQEGEVLIGGINVNELNYDTILKNIAIVFQKTFLTRDSVLENIRMGSDASLEEVRAAAREAQIDDFIMSLPDGYDTKVGSFGSRFSGGEKQRIAIARAILKNAPILILDEATSASDPENQMEIDKAIQNLCKGRTVIVVAHRLSALKMCDRVAVVENHTITSVGTHEEVRKENAYYRKAWEDYETARGITYQLEGGGQNESE